MTEEDVNVAVLLYIDAQVSMKMLAARFGVSPHTIRRRLKARRVPLRASAEQRHSDEVFGRHDQAEAIRAAHAAGRYDTIAYRTRKVGFLPGVDRHGEKNPFHGHSHTMSTRLLLSRAARERTLGGRGEYGPEWTEELRETILARDGYRCGRCRTAEGMLQVHHVDGDKSNSHPSNLLTLCAACHLALHGRREGLSDILAAAARIELRDGSAPIVACAERK